MFRLSKEGDKASIKHLLIDCFGRFPINEGALENLDGRYLIYRNDETGEFLGMTGLKRSKELDGLEIDWSCVKPDCRNQGIMHDLFSRICHLTDEKIYCYCWRITEDGEASMKSLMKDFHFQEIIHGCHSYKYNVNCFRYGTCIYCSRKECRCWKDLYVRV